MKGWKRLIAAGLLIAAGASRGDQPESLFLGEGTNLYLVVVTNAQAVVTNLTSFAFSAESIGASSGVGGGLYVMRNEGILFVDLQTGSQTLTSVTIPGYVASSQADLDPSGWFFFSDAVSNELWALNLPGALATVDALKVGRFVTAGGVSVRVHGGDLAFLADGTLCLWSNWPTDSRAPRGLYLFDVPPTNVWPTNLTAVAEPLHDTVTGAAVPKTGASRFLASVWPDSTIIEVDRSNSQVVATYPMRLDATNYTHGRGDMAMGLYSNGAASESLFLGEGTNLFALTLTSGQASLQLLASLPFSTEPLAASGWADGKVYFLTNQAVVAYDIPAGTWISTPAALPSYISCSQADLSPDGWLCLSDSVSNELWALDLNDAAPTLEARKIGRLVTGAGLPVQLHGGDLGFAADGSLWLWSNWPAGDDAPRGLYMFQLPATNAWPTNVAATVEPLHAILTGMAAPKTGSPTILGSTWPNSTIIQVDPSTFRLTATYPMQIDGTNYAHAHGDMAIGAYSNEIAGDWLASYGLTNLVWGLEAFADKDRDGMLAWQEHLAGTNPTNPASFFALDQVSTAAGSPIVLRWPSISNRVYGVQWSTNLTAPGFLAIASNLPATPPVNVYTDVTCEVRGAFYRILVRQP